MFNNKNRELSMFDALCERNYDIRLFESYIAFESHGDILWRVHGFTRVTGLFLLSKDGSFYGKNAYFCELSDLELLANDSAELMRKLLLTWVSFEG